MSQKKVTTQIRDLVDDLNRRYEASKWDFRSSNSTAKRICAVEAMEALAYCINSLTTTAECCVFTEDDIGIHFSILNNELDAKAEDLHREECRYGTAVLREVKYEVQAIRCRNQIR